jgi:hypothetical protein
MASMFIQRSDGMENLVMFGLTVSVGAVMLTVLFGSAWKV